MANLDNLAQRRRGAAAARDKAKRYRRTVDDYYPEQKNFKSVQREASLQIADSLEREAKTQAKIAKDAERQVLSRNRRKR